MVGVTGQSAFVLHGRWSGARWKADALLPQLKADTVGWFTAPGPEITISGVGWRTAPTPDGLHQVPAFAGCSSWDA